MKRCVAIIAVLLAGILAPPFYSALAQTSLIPEDGILGTCNFLIGDIHFDCIPVYIGYLVKVLLGFAGGFFLFGMFLGGYKYMFGSITSGGTEQGKKEIIGRCIGLAVIILSYLLVDTIIALLVS